MTPESDRYLRAVELIDAANREDPNRETAAGETWPKELLYGRRMNDMIERFAPEADAAMKLAVRAQHIRRWESPRSDYPMDRKGYHQWRTALYDFHAETAGTLLEQAGYDPDTIDRVKQAVGKKALKRNPDTQLLEDVAALVFIEHYMEAFAASKPDYDEAKWITIIQRTWRKMSPQGQEFALSGGIRLPEPLMPLIQKALAD